ncbi:MAG: Membrane protein involved in the export of O-antigen and teichoic acid [Clostridiales bacterium]|nr:Membrane protein involved in the export of O-antigen and teichoic acid [Clostridiales bacterium]
MADIKKFTGNKIVRQGIFLAIATFAVRFIGFLYRIPLTNILGDSGNGIYGPAFEVYSFLLVISSNGIPLVVSKNVSQRLAMKRRKDAEKIFYATLVFSTIVSTVAALVIIIGADFFARSLNIKQLALPLRILAPTIILVSIKGTLFGYFYGRKSTVPAAISQLIEQLMNAVVSVVFAYILISKGPEFGAAGSTLGTVAGALFGLFFMLLLYFAYRKNYRYKLFNDTVNDTETFQSAFKLVSLSIVPIAIGTAVFQITGLVDTFMLSKGLAANGYTNELILSMQGIFSGKFKVLTTLPIAVGPAIAAAIVPSLATSNIKKETNVINNKIHLILKYLMLFAIPASVGLFILANPIMTMLFHDSSPTPTVLLQIGAASIVFYCLSTMTINILQSLDKLKLPVRNLWIALIVKIILNYLLIYIYDFNLNGVVATGVIFSFISSVLNLISIKKETNYRIDYWRVFLIPIISSAIMSIPGVIIYKLLRLISFGNTISTLISIIVCVLTYGVSVLLLKGITENEILMFPKGMTILNLLKKLKLM